MNNQTNSIRIRLAVYVFMFLCVFCCILRGAALADISADGIRALKEAESLDAQLAILNSIAEEYKETLETGGWETDLNVRLAPGMPDGVLPADWEQFQYKSADAFPPELRGHRMIVIDASNEKNPVLAGNLLARFPAEMRADSVASAEYALVIRCVLTPSGYKYTIQVTSSHRDYAAYIIDMKTGQAVCFWTRRNSAYPSGRIGELNGEALTAQETWNILRAQIWDEIRYEQPDGTTLRFGISGTTCYLKGYEGELITADVPASVDGYPVVEIADEAFRGCTTLQNATLPAGLRKISDRAFMCCYGLESISLPDTLERIGNQAFRECSKLKTVDLPKGLKELGESAFLWARRLTAVTLPASLSDIGENAFENCASLARVIIEDGVPHLSRGIFSGAQNIACCYIPDSITSSYSCDIPLITVIYAPEGSKGFQWFEENGYETVACASPEDMPPTEYVTENDMEFLLFRGEAVLAAYLGTGTEATVPETVRGFPVTRIRPWAFYFDQNILRVNIPQSVKTVNKYAFYIEHWKPVDIYFENPDTAIEKGAFARTHVRNHASFILHAREGSGVQQFADSSTKDDVVFEAWTE